MSLKRRTTLPAAICVNSFAAADYGIITRGTRFESGHPVVASYSQYFIAAEALMHVDLPEEWAWVQALQFGSARPCGEWAL